MKLSSLPTLLITSLLSVAFILLGCKVKSTAMGQDDHLVPAPAVAYVTTNSLSTGAQLPQVAAAPATNEVKEVAAASATATNNFAQKVVTGEVQLPENTKKVIELAEAEVGEDVILAYINNVPQAFNLTAEQILYLTDLGISEKILTAMIKHTGALAQQNANAPTAIPSPTQSPSVLPQPGTVPAPGQPSVAITATPQFEASPDAATIAPPPVQVVQQPPVTYVQSQPEVGYETFYTSLAPYGTWVDVPDYGACWRPTVAVVDPVWQPYCQRGHWVYTDCGWYWNSDYSWGWAAFHYGRWYHHDHHGWVWCPDRVWGPAWVTWRYSDRYCGWAPLPPRAHFVEGVGLRFRSGNVGVGFDFGLPHNYYTFVAVGHFTDHTPWRHRLDNREVVNIYNHTTIINNYTERNRTVVNEGPGRERIAAATRSEIQKVALRDAPANSSPANRTEHLVRNGSEMVVYRPQLPKTAPAPARERQEIRKDTVPSKPANENLAARPEIRPQVSGQANGTGGAAAQPWRPVNGRENQVATTTPARNEIPASRPSESQTPAIRPGTITGPQSNRTPVSPNWNNPTRTADRTPNDSEVSHPYQVPPRSSVVVAPPASGFGVPKGQDAGSYTKQAETRSSTAAYNTTPRPLNTFPSQASQPQRPVQNQTYSYPSRVANATAQPYAPAVQNNAAQSYGNRQELPKTATSVHPDKQTYSQPAYAPQQPAQQQNFSRPYNEQVMPSRSPQVSSQPARNASPPPAYNTPRSAPVQVDQSRASRVERPSAPVSSAPQRTTSQPSNNNSGGGRRENGR